MTAGRSPIGTSAAVAILQPRNSTQQRVHHVVDMLDMGAEGKDGAAQRVAAIDPRAAQHHPSLLLQMARQALVERVGVALPGTIAEGYQSGEICFVRRRSRETPESSDRSPEYG